MLMLQHEIFHRLFHLPLKPSSPFSRTVHAPMRSTRELMSDANNYVSCVAKRIMRVQDWRELPDMLSLLHEHGTSTIFGLQHDPDMEHPERQILYLRISEPVFARQKHARDYVDSLFRAFGFPVPRFSMTRFEHELFEKLPPLHDLQSTLKCFNPLGDMDLNHELVWLKWYFLPHEISRFSVDSVPYFRSIGKAMRRLSIKRWKVYLLFCWFHHVAAWFSDTYLLYFKEIEHKVLGIPRPPRAEYHMVELAAHAWWQDASQQFIDADRAYLSKGRELVKSMAEDVRDILMTIFDHTDWKASTIQEAKAKLRNMEFLVGWSDHKFPEFSGLKPTESGKDSFDELMLQGCEYQHGLQILQNGRPTDRRQWRWVPCCEVNAFYSRELNVLFLPASLFYEPLLVVKSAGDHLASNFGSMGSIIAHEIYHGFDYDSRTVDSEGKLTSWWSSKDRKAYEVAAKQAIKLYGEKRNISGNRNINGRLTLSENIADIVSLRMAWQAFVLRYSVQQGENKSQRKVSDKGAITMPPREEAETFFRSFALSQAQIYSPNVVKFILQHDNHSTAMARVNLPLSMFRPFLDLYHVRPSDPMYTRPAHRPEFLPWKEKKSGEKEEEGG